MTRLIRGPLCWSIVAGAAVGAAEKPHMSARSVPAHLRVSDRIGDLLDHPAFAGFSRLLLPWDDRRYDPEMQLRDIGSGFPSHPCGCCGRGVVAQSNDR